MMMARCSVAVIILTLNEELSISAALQSVKGWADEIFVVDSFSTDKTEEIAEKFGATVYKNKFESFAAQRNWALGNLPLRSEWVLFLDADEYVPQELREEISRALRSVSANVNGFYTKMNFIFIGKRLKHGNLYTSLIRLFRKDKGHFIEAGGYREKIAVTGTLANLEHPLVHDDKKLLTDWIVDQSSRILADARDRVTNAGKQSLPPTVLPHATVEGGRSRWLRNQLLLKLPMPLQPFAQFFYRYILCLGFLYGWPGFVYHFLLQFWFPLMVVATCSDLERRKQ
jgi:hypothetical protein